MPLSESVRVVSSDELAVFADPRHLGDGMHCSVAVSAQQHQILPGVVGVIPVEVKMVDMSAPLAVRATADFTATPILGPASDSGITVGLLEVTAALTVAGLAIPTDTAVSVAASATVLVAMFVAHCFGGRIYRTVALAAEPLAQSLGGFLFGVLGQCGKAVLTVGPARNKVLRASAAFATVGTHDLVHGIRVESEFSGYGATVTKPSMGGDNKSNISFGATRHGLHPTMEVRHS